MTTTKEGLGRVKDLLDGHHAKAYTLPGELLRREGTIERLEEARAKARGAAAEARHHNVDRSLVTEALERASSGKETRLVDAARYFKTVEARATTEFEARVLESALTMARANLVSSVADLSQVIDCLREPFELAEAGEHAAALEGIADATAALTAGDKEVAAWRKLEQLARRYSQLRRAWRCVFDAAIRDEVEDPAFAEAFSVLSNYGEMFPHHRRAPEQMPWPRELVPYLCWLVTSGARPWLPLAQDFEPVFTAERARINEVQNRSSAPRHQAPD